MTRFAAGQAVSRIEDAALLKGVGRYADDVHLAHAAHAVILRSPHAHARILAIDTRAAAAMPGVLAVLTGRDAQADGLGVIPCLIPVVNRDGTDRADTPRPILAVDRTRHVGDPVAVVVAESFAQAKDAAEAIVVDYEPLPAIADVRRAVAPDAPQVWDHVSGNVAFHVGAGESEAAVAAAFARAAHVTRLELVNNRIVASSIEPRARQSSMNAEAARKASPRPR